MLRCTWTHVFVFSNDDDDENNDSQKWLEVVRRVGGGYWCWKRSISKPSKAASKRCFMVSSGSQENRWECRLKTDLQTNRYDALISVILKGAKKMWYQLFHTTPNSIMLLKKVTMESH